MLNEGDFRKTVTDMISNPNSYTKEEYYSAFLEMTERYLDGMITTTSLEKAITEGMDEENANKILEDIATSNPSLNDLESINVKEPDRAEVIRNLMDYIECEFGLNIDNDKE